MFDATFYRGRVGLFAVLRALGIGRGDQVAIQAFTCLAVPEAVIATGAQPLYVDIEGNSVNMSATDLERRLSPSTRAIVVQHTFGIPARMDRIVEIAKGHDIAIIEDCCHSYSSSFGSRTIGEFGVAAFYSLEWGKPLVCGIGGGIRVRDTVLRNAVSRIASEQSAPALSSTLRVELQYVAFKILYWPSTYWRLKRLFGRLSRAGAVVGNYNEISGRPAPDFFLGMSTLHRNRLARAATQLERIDAHSRAISQRYQEIVENSADLEGLAVNGESRAVLARFPAWAIDKEALLARAEQSGVEIADWYNTPIHPVAIADAGSLGYSRGDCPTAEQACSRIVSFPTNRRAGERYLAKLERLVSERRR